MITLGTNSIIISFERNSIILCAVLSCHKDFYYGVQCRKCQLACHLRCHLLLHYNNNGFDVPCFDVPCLDTPEELKQRLLKFPRKHQFVPLFNTSANWCCYCGCFLSLGQGNSEGANRRCAKCGLTCHAQYQVLVNKACDEKILRETYKAEED